MGEDLVGHSHQVMTPMTSTPAAAAAIARRVVLRRCAALMGTLAVGNPAWTASGRNAKTLTERAIFLTLCSPLSSKG
jgi:hypothetical protein